MMLKNLLQAMVLLLLTTCMLTGCGSNQRLTELQKYVAQLKQSVMANSNKTKNFNYQLPMPVKYSGMVTNQTTNNNTQQTVLPTGKPGSPLQAYPIQALQFVGTIQNGNSTWAYIVTPDNMMYQAKEGDIIGNTYGKITKIVDDHIEILEKVAGPEPSNKPSQRIVTMLLKE